MNSLYMLNAGQKAKLAFAVKGLPEFNSFGIIYNNADKSEELLKPTMPIGFGTWLLIEDSDNSAAKAASADSKSIQFGVPKAENIKSVVGACGSAVIAGFAVAGETIAIPSTMGASAAMLAFTWGPTAATGLQCGVAVGRVVNDVFFPDNNKILDNSTAYRTTMTVADIWTLIGDIKGLGEGMPYLFKLKKASGGRSILTFKGGFKVALREFNHAERKVLAYELSSAASRSEFKRLVRAGKVPKLMNSIELNLMTKKRLLQAISSAIDFEESATSGAIKKLTIKIMHEQ